MKPLVLTPLKTIGVFGPGTFEIITVALLKTQIVII